MNVIASPDAKLSDANGYSTARTRIWLDQVTSLQIISAAGSPEGSQAADQTRLYMDNTGTAGNILYIKRDADIGGDTTKGWILV
tara:strand:+ start:254 stop:505 length:252 start_codon:yes stop_codon:yes gene_type:complete